MKDFLPQHYFLFGICSIYRRHNYTGVVWEHRATESSEDAESVVPTPDECRCSISVKQKTLTTQFSANTKTPLL